MKKESKVIYVTSPGLPSTAPNVATTC